MDNIKYYTEQAPTKVGARLMTFAKEWSILGSKWLLSIVSEGYKVPVMSTPAVPAGLPDFFGPATYEAKVMEHVQGLLKKGTVYEISRRRADGGITSPLLLVKKKSGELRPCLDLRYVNKCLPYTKFKMENLQNVRQMVQPGDFMTSIDLKDGYLHTPVAHESQNLLQFKLRNRFYRFNSLPFGLSTAPRLFTKVLRPVVQWCRQQGIRIMVYLDDFLILASSYDQAVQHTAVVMELLEKLGWIINKEKSSLIPATRMEFLGFLLDTVKMLLMVPVEKRKRFRNSCKRMVKLVQTGRSVSLRAMAALVGKLQSIAPAVPFAWLHLQEMVHMVRKRTEEVPPLQVRWDELLQVPNKVVNEILWWIMFMRGWNGNSIIPTEATADLFSDASDHGYGGHLIMKGKRHSKVVQGHWNAEEQLLSTNARELLAAERVVSAYLRWAKLKDCVIRLLTDNIVTMVYVNKMGGRFPHLQAIVARMLGQCESSRVTVVAEHLPGVKNKLADALSRMPKDRTDWRLHPQVFSFLDQIWALTQWISSRQGTTLSYRGSQNLENGEKTATYIDGSGRTDTQV